MDTLTTTITTQTYTNSLLYRRVSSFKDKIHSALIDQLQKENPNSIIDPLTYSFSASETKGSRKCEDKMLVTLSAISSSPISTR